MWTVREVNKGDFEAINQLNTEQLMGSGVLNPSYQVSLFYKRVLRATSLKHECSISFTPQTCSYSK